MTLFELINQEVSIYDLFDLADPPVKYLTKDKPCQISCPFHGKDTHPSARVYPDTNSFRCFYCSKSWGAVTFWAESCGYFKADNSLDISRSLNDLSARYNISDTSFDWQKKFYAIKKQHEEEKEEPLENKKSLVDYYSWQISNKIYKLKNSDRVHLKQSVFLIWSMLEKIDLNAPSWEADLKSWYEDAKIKVNV